MIKNFLIRLFGVNYQTSVASIFIAIGLIPGAISTITFMYAGQLTFPIWVTVTGIVCTFVSIIYNGTKTRSKDVSGTGENAKINVDGQMKTEKQILDK